MNQQHQILEENRPLSQSLLWRLQRNYFERQGIQAWSQAAVPQYITSNPAIANAYAQVLFAFLRDCRRDSSQSVDLDQPIYIVELGAGSGRFAFHFMRKFFGFFKRSVLKDLPVQYVMTDFAARNVAAYQAHPSLQPFVAAGLLDFACFDATQSEEIRLSQSGAVLTPNTLANPLIVLANYFFDSIPQDLFRVQDGRLYEGRITLTGGPQPEPDLDDPDILDRVDISYEHYAVPTDYYHDSDLDAILQDYCQRLSETTFLFPCAALQCIRRLRRLAGGRLLLLSGDKGYIHEDELMGRQEPGLNLHGSFSFMVNYHAIAQFTRNQGGRVWQTSHRHTNLNICAFLFGNPQHDYTETSQAYDAWLEENGPDDFFALKKGLEPHYDTLALPYLLSYLRLSGWDANIFQGCYASLAKQVSAATEALRQELYWAIHEIWDGYYHIGETWDLPFHLGVLLYKMGFYSEALDYLQHSLTLYGPDPGAFYNVALCHYSLQQWDAALEAADQALALDPSDKAAQELRVKIEGAGAT